jgi:hypothetical protein
MNIPVEAITLTEFLYKVRRARTMFAPKTKDLKGAQTELKDLDRCLVDILLSFGYEPGTTSEQVDDLKLLLMSRKATARPISQKAASNLVPPPCDNCGKPATDIQHENGMVSGAVCDDHKRTTDTRDLYTIDPFVPSEVPLVVFEPIVGGGFSLTRGRERELTQLVIDAGHQPVVFDFHRNQVMVANWTRFVASLSEKARNLGGRAVFLDMSGTIKDVFAVVAPKTTLLHASSFAEVAKVVAAARETDEPLECPCCGRGHFSVHCLACEHDETVITYDFSRKDQTLHAPTEEPEVMAMVPASEHGAFQLTKPSTNDSIASALLEAARIEGSEYLLHRGVSRWNTFVQRAVFGDEPGAKSRFLEDDRGLPVRPWIHKHGVDTGDLVALAKGYVEWVREACAVFKKSCWDQTTNEE